MVYSNERLALSVREVSFLKLLCTNSFTIGQLARHEHVSPGFSSQLVNSLKAKTLVLVDSRGSERLVRLSDASHAQAFKRLVDSRPSAKVESWLSGNSLEVLVLASFRDGLTIPAIATESRLSIPTVYRVVKKLQAAGVVVRTGGKVLVSDAFVESFANQFADNVLFQLQKQFNGHNVYARVRKHVVVRSDGVFVPDFAVPTGLNALVEAGLEAVLTSYRDYYFNLDCVKRKLSLEENFVHALLLTSVQQRQDETVLGLFWAKNGRKLDRVLLRNLAEDYSVELNLSGVLRDLRVAVDLANKLR
ncbi:MarR family transcriptional regulator [Candidatus Micrarchaeota archaeon]|nr:MarR family transcriptional regulator [Candidatus Micrarchaeota archaeon]